MELTNLSFSIASVNGGSRDLCLSNGTRGKTTQIQIWDQSRQCPVKRLDLLLITFPQKSRLMAAGILKRVRNLMELPSSPFDVSDCSFLAARICCSSVIGIVFRCPHSGLILQVPGEL